MGSPFLNDKPILGMLHLSGSSQDERLAIARQEVDALIAGGVDAVVVENYFGGVDDIETILDWLSSARPQVTVGVNVLRDYRKAFELVSRFDVKFIQVDSVAGHLSPSKDATFDQELAELRDRAPVCLLGGVRFKYQPVLSDRSLKEDIQIGMTRCDAIVVTGEATGQETDLDKVRQFRQIVGANFPLLIGAGLTAANCRQQLDVADGAIVGSYFKDNYRDDGIVDPVHVARIMDIVNDLRREQMTSTIGLEG